MQLSIKAIHISKLIGMLCISSLCVISISELQKPQLENINSSLSKEKYLIEEEIKQANINLLKRMPSFGFSNLVSDLAYLQFLQYFGDGEAREKTGYSLSSDYLQTIVQKDPRFVRAYFLTAPASSIFAGKPEETVKTLEMGLKSVTPDLHPHSYYLWVYKAVDEMLFLDRVESAKKSYQMAVKWSEDINTSDSLASAKNITNTIKHINNNPNSVVARIGAWSLVLSSANDDKTQQKALKEIEKLGGEIIVSPDGQVNIKVPEDAT